MISNRLPECTDKTAPEYLFPVHKEAIEIVTKLLYDNTVICCIASRSIYKTRCLDTLAHHGCPTELFKHVVIEHTVEAGGKTPHLKEIAAALDVTDFRRMILYDDSLLNCQSARALGCQYVHVSLDTGLTRSNFCDKVAPECSVPAARY